MVETVVAYVEQIIAVVLPHATTGVLVAAGVVAVSRLPLLSIAGMTAACVCLGALLSTGEGGFEAGLAFVVAGGAAGGILLLSGSALWQRPSLRTMLHRPSPRPSPRKGEGAYTPSPPQGEDKDEGGIGGDRPSPRPSPLQREGERAGQNIVFRLAATALVTLAAEALTAVAPLPLAVDERRVVLYLIGMGAIAAFSQGSAIVSATGYIVALSAAAFFVPVVVADLATHSMAYGAIAAVIILAALGFSFAEPVRKESRQTADEL